MEIFDSFLAFKTENTKRGYTTVIKAFFQDDSLDVTAADVINYLAGMKTSGAAPGTVRHHYNVLRSLFAYAVDVGLLDHNPAAAAKRVLRFNDRKQVRPTKLIAFEDVSRIIDGIKVCGTEKARCDAVRDMALIACLFGCGLRRSEAASLTLKSLILFNKQPYFNVIQTKAGLPQKAIISTWAWEYLCRWTIVRYRQSSSLSGALFSRTSAAGEYAGPLSCSTVYRIYRRRLAAVGLDAAPHSARATAATAALSDGHDVLSVARFLRHGDTKVVSAYDKRKDAYEGLPDLSF